MKKVLSILLLFCLTTSVMAQPKREVSFDENPPNQPPAIFAATMPPCLIGVAHQYGESLGISALTLKEAENFINEAHQKVPEFKKKVKALEIDIMNASREERYEDYEKLLKTLSEVKIEASLFHEGLVKRAREVFAEEDVQKLDDFIFSHQDVFLAAHKLN